MREQSIKDGMKEQERNHWKETGRNTDSSRYVENTVPGRFHLVCIERAVA